MSSEAGSLLETHYNELLKTIEEIGRDVKPSYTSNKVSTDRLKKSKPLAVIIHALPLIASVCVCADIMMARGVLRDCMGDLERLASSSN